MDGTLIILALLVLLLVVFVMMAVRVVRQGYVYTIERFASSRRRPIRASTSSPRSSIGSGTRST